MHDLNKNASPRVVGNSDRMPWLDVLRGVAILLVLCHHLGLVAPVGNSPFYRCLYAVNCAGWAGVDIFFVLSGFLVSGILFRQFRETGRIRPVQFLIRRGFKIYPAFWLMICVTLIVTGLAGQSVSMRKILVELLFLQNYIHGIWTHTWSLAVEEHSYLGLCLLLTVLVRLNSNRKNPFAFIPTIVLVVMLAVCLIRILNSREVDVRRIFLNNVFPTHLRCDTFLCGVLVGYWFHFCDQRFLKSCERLRWSYLFGGLVCLSPVLFWKFQTDRIVWTLLFSSNAVGGSFLVMWALGTRRPLGTLSSFVAMIGRHSYSIYLWHGLIVVNLLHWGFRTTKVPGGLYSFVPVYFFVTISSGILLSWLIERPSLYWRERLCPNDDRVPIHPVSERENFANPIECVPQCTPTGA
ncbi:MAG: lipopolysaccharide modification acyltransferase [Planctomycetaceae bacterium]|nr:lipopolysaccharide modification acyltransferase [Planctomycetaceae bacterium]